MRVDALADQPAVDFELALARPAEEAEAAALALQMGPALHQAAALIGQMRVLDLKRALLGVRALRPKISRISPVRSSTLAPQAFSRLRCCTGESAQSITTMPASRLLHEAGDLLDLAVADVGRGPDLAERHDAGLHDLEVDGARKPDRLFQPRARRALVRRRATRSRRGGTRR